MTDTNPVESFFAAVQAADIDALAPLLADDFLYEDPTAPTALNKTDFMAWVNNLAAACPDLAIEAHAVGILDGGVVADLAIVGTVAHDLDLGLFGQGIIAATNEVLRLPPQTLTFTIINGRIGSVVAADVEGAGIGAILAGVAGLATAPA